MTITISIPSKEAQRILNGQGSGNSTEDERFQDAADTDTCNFFAVMSQYYKPEDFMLTVGILLAQGIARISDKKKTGNRSGGVCVSAEKAWWRGPNQTGAEVL